MLRGWQKDNSTQIKASKIEEQIGTNVVVLGKRCEEVKRIMQERKNSNTLFIDKERRELMWIKLILVVKLFICKSCTCVLSIKHSERHSRKLLNATATFKPIQESFTDRLTPSMTPRLLMFQ